MARLNPQLRLYPEGGQVVVTRFECPSVPVLLALRLRHAAMRRHVRRHATGFLGVTMLIDWRSRVLLSLSLWEDLGSIYSMGMVSEHVAAVRLPAVLGVNTTCGIFCLVGDWRAVMFGSPSAARSPLLPLTPAAEPTSRQHHDNRRSTEGRNPGAGTGRNCEKSGQ